LRRKVSVRLSDDDVRKLDELLRFMRWMLGTGKVSKSHIIREALTTYYYSLAELESWRVWRRYEEEGKPT